MSTEENEMVAGRPVRGRTTSPTGRGPTAPSGTAPGRHVPRHQDIDASCGSAQEKQVNRLR